MPRPLVMLLFPLLFAASVASASPLVVWVDPAGTVHARATDGDAEPVLLATDACVATPALATAPTAHLAVWTDCASHHAFGQILASDGLPVGTPFEVSKESASSPHAAFDGEVFLCAWETSQTIRAARISAAGLLLDPSSILLAPAPARHPALASSPNGGFLVAWESWEQWPGDIYASRIDAAGSASPAIAIATEPGGDQSPTVAWEEDGFTVTWQKSASDSWFSVPAMARVE